MGERPGDREPGRAVVVGTSDGIGLALTRRLLAEGWGVAGLSRSPSPVEDESYRHTVIDVTAPGYPAELAAAIAQLGGVDLCVHVAGVGEFLDVTDLSGQTRTLEVNLMGAAATLAGVVPAMVAAGGGHVIVLSSLADAAVSDAAPAYAASKAGLTAYCQGLALALRPHGVTVTTVRLGFVDTKLAKAPSTPMLMSPQRAAGVVMDAVRRRPAVVSRPRRMAVAMRVLGAVQGARLRIRPGTAAAGPGRPR